MTRNEIIKSAGSLLDRAKVSANTPEAWSIVGLLEAFVNDLCDCPTRRNRDLGATVYTVKQAKVRLKELRERVEKL